MARGKAEASGLNIGLGWLEQKHDIWLQEKILCKLI